MITKDEVLKKVANGQLSVKEAAALLLPVNKTKAANFSAIYKSAQEAGMVAANAITPTPMVVQQHSNVLNDKSPVVKQWFVGDGACGFAWVQFPGNTAWARWAKVHANARPAYPKGLSIWVHQFGQSMQRKEAYGHAFAQVLNKHGIKAWCGSRMD